MKHLIPLLAVLMAVACSVKEERSMCPNRLTLLLDRATRQMSLIREDSLTVSVRTGRSFRSTGTVDPSAYASGLDIESPRGRAEIGAFTGLRHSVLSESALTLPEGCEADSLFAHAAAVDCAGEAAYDTVILHKQFATLTVVMKGASLGTGYSLSVSGGWNGTDLYSLAPLPGGFRAPMRHVSAEVYKVRVPRQGDSSLKLHVEVPGKPEAVFAVGESLARSGYRWEAEDLPDVSLTLDVTDSNLSVTLEGWFDGGSKEYEI